MPMRQPQPQDLLREFGRAGPYVERGFITGTEFINKAFSELADAGQVYSDIVPGLLALVPRGIRAEFASAVQNATQPDYSFREFFIGPGPNGNGPR
jgi:hypothetical protein